MVSKSSKPPTDEIGYVTQYGDDKNPGDLINWASILDERETNRDLAFPMSVETYRKMRSTDAVITAILNAITMPIRRFTWMVDPNGARDEVVEMVARNFNMPVKGALDEPVKRSFNKFNHDLHLKQVLRGMLTFGFHYTEQIGEIADGKFRYRKLAPRPQHTITKVRIASDGGLMGIQQGYGVDAPSVSVDRLIAYIYNQEPGSWTGESMLRAMYRPWKIKDRILRVGAINIERAGGIPWIEAGKDANRGEILKAKEFAQQFRVGETAGGALPYGWQLKFAQAAGGSEAAEYVKLQNQEMATAALAMFLNLGTTETGSRALGEGFIDFFSLQLDTIAGEYAATENAHGVEDLVTWNYGEEEQSPLIVYDRNPNPKLAIAELVSLIGAGAIVVDNDLEDELRGEYGVTPAVRLEAAPVQAPAFGYDLDNPILKIDDRRAQLGLDPREDGLGNLTVPEFMAVLDQTTKGAASTMPEEGAATAALGSDFVAASKERQSITFRAVAETVYAAKDPNERVKLPANRELHRQPKDFEVAAALNLEAIEDAWNTILDALLAAWKKLRGGQITTLTDQIRKATSIADLVNLELDAGDSTKVLEDAMIEMVAEGIEQAIEEAKAQGVTIPEPDIDTLADEIEERAGVIAQMIADELRNAAVRNATDVSGAGEDFDADEIADIVDQQLNELKDGWLQKQLQGALANAMATGRVAAQEGGDDKAEHYYPTSILDANTCTFCAQNDGHEYTSLKDALKDYPIGPYLKCKGRKLCRCFIVGKYKEGYTVDPSVAAARKPGHSGKPVARNNAGQFGSKDIRLKGMQDRIKANKTGANRVKPGQLTAEDKVKNFRTMHGKDPSPAQMKKLGIDPKVAKGSGVTTPKKLGDFPERKTIEEYADKRIAALDDVMSPDNKFIDKTGRNYALGQSFEMHDLKEKLDKLAQVEDVSAYLDDREKSLNDVLDKDNKFIDANGRNLANGQLSEVIDARSFVTKLDTKKPGLASKVVKFVGDLLARNTKAKTDIEGIFGRKLDTDEQAIIDKMFETAKPVAPKPAGTPKQKAKPKDGEGGSSSSGKSKGGSSRKTSTKTKPPETVRDKAQAAADVLEGALGRPLSYDERTLVDEMARVAPTPTAGKNGGENGGSGNEGGDSPTPTAKVITAIAAKGRDIEAEKRTARDNAVSDTLDKEIDQLSRRLAFPDRLTAAEKEEYAFRRDRADKMRGILVTDGADAALKELAANPDRERVGGDVITRPLVNRMSINVTKAEVAVDAKIVPGQGVRSNYTAKGTKHAARKKFDAGVADIMSVHNPDCQLVFEGGASRGHNGTFFSGRTPNGTIGLNAKRARPTTAVHEAAHAMDFQMFANKGVEAQGMQSKLRFGSEQAAADTKHTLRGWYDSVMGSNAIQRIKDEYNHRTGRLAQEGYRIKAGHVKYLSDPCELFARSYEQWIALRTGKPELKSSLTSNTMSGSYWPDDEFEPIAAEFDKVFGIEGN